MERFTYVIIGGGMTADAAVDGIREIDADGTIALFSKEPDPPYSRPPLTKGLWKGDDPASVWRGTAEKGAEVRTAVEISAIDLTARQLVDAAGAVYGYEKLLLATGGVPRTLPLGGERVLYYRTLADYRALKAMAERHERFAVIGAGFIGSEIAAALAMNGKRVVELFPGEAIGARAYPPALAGFLNDYYREHGVEVVAGEEATGLEERDAELVLTTKGGRELAVDCVVAGIGIRPSTELAEAGGIQVDDGIVVDEQLRTTAPNVYAAGDVASFLSSQLDRRLRVEHEDNALTMGRHAGATMARHLAGHDSEPYQHLPFFYSDLFDLGYEAVGDLDARLETVEDWLDPYQQGVVYYLDGSRVRGVLLWNVWGKVDAARALVAADGPFSAEGLVGRIRPD